MLIQLMAVHETSGSWSGTSGSYWGLSRKIGPWKSTPLDEVKANSRAGGPHSGHGNWWQSFNPHPYIQTRPTSKTYSYVQVMEDEFEPPVGMKIPGAKGGKGSRVRRDVYSKQLIGGEVDLKPMNEKDGNYQFKRSLGSLSDKDGLQNLKDEINYKRGGGGEEQGGAAVESPTLAYDRRGSIRDTENQEETRAMLNLERLRTRRILKASSQKKKKQAEEQKRKRKGEPLDRDPLFTGGRQNEVINNRRELAGSRLKRRDSLKNTELQGAVNSLRSIPRRRSFVDPRPSENVFGQGFSTRD